MEICPPLHRAVWGVVKLTRANPRASSLCVTVGRCLLCKLSSRKFYMFPFCSPCLSGSKTVFVFTVALLSPIEVLWAENGNFYNVKGALTMNL